MHILVPWTQAPQSPVIPRIINNSPTPNVQTPTVVALKHTYWLHTGAIAELLYDWSVVPPSIEELTWLVSCIVIYWGTTLLNNKYDF